MRALKNKILIKIDTKQKEKYRLVGTDAVIHIEKGYNFNLREDRASMAYVIDGCGLPKGAKCLVHHHSVEENYAVPNFGYLTEAEIAEGFKIYNLEKNMVFMYQDAWDWFPCEDFLITKRLYEVYKGAIEGIEPKKLDTIMYVVKGFSEEFDGERIDLSGKYINVTVNADYEIIYHDTDNRPHSIIRSRSREVLAINNTIADKVAKGDYIVAINEEELKPREGWVATGLPETEDLFRTNTTGTWDN